MFKIGLCVDVNGLISFNVGMMVNMTKSYNFMPVGIILTVTQCRNVKRKLELVQSFCCEVA